MKKVILALILVLFIIIGGLSLINMIERHEEAEQYNGGICTECGGHLIQYDSAFDRALGSTFNYFICDHCHAHYAFKFFGKN